MCYDFNFGPGTKLTVVGKARVSSEYDEAGLSPGEDSLPWGREG